MSGTRAGYSAQPATNQEPASRMKNRMDIIEELRWRGSIYDITPGADELLEREKISVYVGFDPSARSLHVGNMVPIMGLVRMQRHGHSPIKSSRTQRISGNQRLSMRIICSRLLAGSPMEKYRTATS